MHRYLPSLILLCTLAFSAPAQEKPIAISFEAFESWMKELSPMGYPFTETGKNGAEYLATFLNKETMKMIGITLSPLSAFDDYKKFKGAIPYDYKGHRAVFYGMQNFWNLTIELPNIHACFQITTVYLEATKEQLEQEVDRSGALKK